MPRGLRQLKIIELVNNNDVETQAELTQLLIDSGFGATQATVSRDIKELGITKIMTPQRRYKYVYGSAEKTISNKYTNLFKEAVSDIRSAGNIIVVKTIVGSANSAAAFVDSLNIPEIIGSIAGDDTILLVISSQNAVEAVIKTLGSYTE